MEKELKEESKRRLGTSVKKRMTTIMIGSLAIIEEELLQNQNDIYLQSVYDIIRKRILDLGNQQIKYILQEFEDYSIESDRFIVIKNGKMEINQEGK